MFENPSGATELTDEEKEGLKIRTITTRTELNRWEQENISKAHAWYQKKRSLTISDIDNLKTLHKKMFGTVWEWAGKFRRSNKNIGVNWPQIPIKAKILLDDVNYWIDHQTYSQPEICARFHHGLVAIHLFSNGNGRHARLASDIMMDKQFGLEPFEWGTEILSEKSGRRKEYISSLHAADKGDFKPLYIFLGL